VHCVVSAARQWNHIEDLDDFFTRVYHYHQRSGFLCMVLQDVLQLLYVVLFLLLPFCVCMFYCTVKLLTASYGLHGGNALWFICWHRCYIHCLFVSLLNFLFHLLSYLLSSFLMLSFLLVYFLTDLLPDLSIYSFQNRPILFPGQMS